MRIGGDREDKGFTDHRKFIAALFRLRLKVRQGLEGVGIHIFVVQCFVGQHIIIEGDHFDVEMIFILRNLLHHFPDGFVRPGIDSDFHFIIFIRRAGAQQGDRGGD